MEHALKSSSFLKSTVDGDKAEVCWDSFAKSIDKDFFQAIKERRKHWEIFVDPPRRQIVTSGRLDFEGKGPEIKNNHDLFLAIRRVRNNLFHGGKYLHSSYIDPVRNEELLEECIFILSEAMKLDAGVNQIFLDKSFV